MLSLRPLGHDLLLYYILAIIITKHGINIGYYKKKALEIWK